eukprot:UN01240
MRMTFVLVIFILFDGVFSYKSTQNALIRHYQACPCYDPQNHEQYDSKCPCLGSGDGDDYIKNLQHKKIHYLRRKHRKNKHIPYYSALTMDTDTDTDIESSNNDTHAHGLDGNLC